MTDWLVIGLSYTISIEESYDATMPLLEQVSTCAISNIIPIIQKYLILSVHASAGASTMSLS
jgi:hypothetical protein